MRTSDAGVRIFCPSDVALARYVGGGPPEGEGRRIEEHPDECDDCGETAQQWERPLLDGRRTTPWPDGFLAESGAQVARDRALRVPAPRRSRFRAGDEIDDFRLLNELGSGAFADVFLAQQRSMQRLVALKISGRRSHEAQVLSHLEHPHIVRVFDERVVSDRRTTSGEEFCLLYMQYVPGGNLEQVVERIRQVEPEFRSGRALQDVVAEHMEGRGEARSDLSRDGSLDRGDWASTVCWIGARLADALHYAHGENVLHRDIKPANVLLTADGSPLLADFNLSFGAYVEGAGPDDCFGGSLAYMSPEQLEVLAGVRQAQDVGAASDLFSLGVLLWELLTGERPFRSPRADKDAITRMIAERRRGVPLSSLPQCCPEVLRQVLGDCLAADPADRPTDSAAVARGLQLCTIPEVNRLMTPPPGSWPAGAARWPMTTVILCGLVPNLVLAVLNIVYNYSFSGLDQGLHQQAQWYVNATVFPLGIAVLFGWSRPIARAMIPAAGDASGQDGDSVGSAAERCLSTGTFLWWMCMTLWVATGIVYPLWNDLGGDDLTLASYAKYVTSQALHGVIASSVALLLVTLVAVRSFVPRLVRQGLDPEFRQRLSRLDVLATRHTAWLGLTPPCALMALAWFDHYSSMLLLALGLFGALGYGLALLLLPKIHSTIRTLQVALTPTHQLLYGEPVTRETP